MIDVMDQTENDLDFNAYSDEKIEKEVFDYVNLGLTPFSSQETRENGRRLILISFLSLLLSFKIVSIGKGDFLGLDVTLLNTTYLVGISLIVCVYLLTLYLFDIIQERKIWNKKSEDLKNNKKEFFYHPLIDLLNINSHQRDLLVAKNEEEQKLLRNKLALEDEYVAEHEGLDYVERNKIYDKHQNDFQDRLKIHHDKNTAINKTIRKCASKLETIFYQSKRNYEIRTIIEITIPFGITLLAIAKCIIYYK
jgi:hypothetical protein